MSLSKLAARALIVSCPEQASMFPVTRVAKSFFNIFEPYPTLLVALEMLPPDKLDGINYQRISETGERVAAVAV